MWSKRKRKLYYKKYREEHKEELRKYNKEYSRKLRQITTISVKEKRECYATGNYEKAIEELKKKKWIK